VVLQITDVSERLIANGGWVEYRTRLDLLNEPPGSPAVLTAKNNLLADTLVQGLVAELTNWPGTVIASHKSAGQPFHKLTFLADIGLDQSDPGMAEIITCILAHQSQEGPFQLPMNIGTAYGGTGQDAWGWALCDAPLLLYALVKFGIGEDIRVQKGIQYLVALARENGWPCVVSKELGNWRGPGRKEDPCPFATLAMLKLLSTRDELIDSQVSHQGVEALLTLWQRSQTWHPYIFYMGDDFRKLKVPFIWYDLVHVLEVLSHFPSARTDPRYREMLTTLRQKMDSNGTFTLESTWNAWKSWEFGQKKVPSRWLTLACWRILERTDKEVSS
jgi:hypothetical protein